MSFFLRRFLVIVIIALPLPAFSQEKPDSTGTGDVTAARLEAEVDSIASAIRLRYADYLRGTTLRQWDSTITEIKSHIESGHRFKEDYLYALRNFGRVINDGHLWFPDGGFFNRERYFSPGDSIFPAWTKISRDCRLFVEKDYSGRLPHNAEILTVNGLPSDSLARRTLSLCYGEKEYARSVHNSDGDPRTWNNFTNLLYMEDMTSPYIVEYKEYGCDIVRKDTLQSMTREERLKAYRKEKPKAGKAIYYRKAGDRTGILRIRSFYGGNTWALVQTVLWGRDLIYPRLMNRSMRKLKRHSPENLIIDIRGNQGGSMEYMLNTLSCFTEDTLSLPEYVYVPLADRKPVREMIKVRMEKKVSEHALDSLLNVFDSAKAGGSIVMQEITPRKKPGYIYSGDIFLITDEGTYSAAIVFADLFRRHGIGAVAGVRPGGYRQVTSGNKVAVPLPYTFWLPLEIPYGMFYRPEENYRYDFVEPDIPIETSMDSWLTGRDEMLEKLIDLIETENG